MKKEYEKKKIAAQGVTKKIKIGDTVFIRTGNFKGQNGKVLQKQGQYVTVQGVNVRKKHVKKSQQNPQGAIQEMEGPMHISKVQLSIDNQPVKIKVKTNKEGKRVLFYRDGDQEVVYRQIGKTASKK